jgi:peptidyl-tRNA hydrolase
MGKGKVAAQCSHATLGAYKLAEKHCKSALKVWEWVGTAKIAVKVPTEEEMHAIARKVYMQTTCT